MFAEFIAAQQYHKALNYFSSKICKYMNDIISDVPNEILRTELTISNIIVKFLLYKINANNTMLNTDETYNEIIDLLYSLSNEQEIINKLLDKSNDVYLILINNNKLCNETSNEFKLAYIIYKLGKIINKLLSEITLLKGNCGSNDQMFSNAIHNFKKINSDLYYDENEIRFKLQDFFNLEQFCDKLKIIKCLTKSDDEKMIAINELEKDKKEMLKYLADLRNEYDKLLISIKKMAKHYLLLFNENNRLNVILTQNKIIS